MTSLFKNLSIFIKIGAIKRYGVCLASFKIVNRIRRHSSRIVFTPPTPTRQNSFVASAVYTHRRRDETRQFRLVGVGGVYWAFNAVNQINTKFEATLKTTNAPSWVILETG